MIKVATDIKHFIVIVYTNAVLKVTNVSVYTFLINNGASINLSYIYIFFL